MKHVLPIVFPMATLFPQLLLEDDRCDDLLKAAHSVFGSEEFNDLVVDARSMGQEEW